jgi:hypothetical protein
MKNEAESHALEQLYNTTSLGRVFEHRILYEAELHRGEQYPSAVAMELTQQSYVVFTVTGGTALSFEFIAFFDRRDKAIEAVFSLIPK